MNTNTVLVIYDNKDPHQSIRLVYGLRACGLAVSVIDNPDDLPITTNLKFDAIFVEASVKRDLSFLASWNKEYIILYDVEDKPEWFKPNLAYLSLLPHTKWYGKYNYRTKYNIDNLKHIGLPQVDYINKGSILAKKVYPALKDIKQLGDVFFLGGPTYTTNYTPLFPINSNYTYRDNLKVVVKRPSDSGLLCESDWLYNQRLEWVDNLHTSGSVNILAAALHYTNDPNRKHPLSIEYHTDLFGSDCSKYIAKASPPDHYYTNMMSVPFGLCPSGVARSSYRLIELMALGRIIISTKHEDYTYLYNPKQIIYIEDGADVSSVILSIKDKTSSLLESSKENVELFSNITPEKMWKDFKNQLCI